MTRRGAVVLGLALVALVLRLLHLRVAADILLHDSPDVGMDRWLAMRTAMAVAEGDWLGGWMADYDSGPGYAYLLGLLYRLGGERWLPALALQALLGAAVVPLAYGLGRRLFSPTVGLVAAVLASLYGPTIFYETLLVKFSLVPIAVASLLLATHRARETGDAWRTGLAGALLGILVVLRGNALLVFPVIAWWAAGERPGRARMARAAALVALGTLVVLAPLLVRDRVAAGRGLGTSLWGIHFYIAAHPGADGTYAPVEDVRQDPIGHVVDARRIAEGAAGHTLSPTGVSLYWVGRGLAFARAEPWHFVQLQARKLRLVLAAFEEGSFGEDFADLEDASWVLRLPLPTFGALCPLALLGILVALARRRGELLPAFVGAYTLSLLPFFVTGRYRLPIVVPMQVLAAVGLVWLDETRRRGDWRLLAAAAAGMAVVAFGLPGEAIDRLGLLAVAVVGLGALAAARAIGGRQSPT